MFSEKFKSVKEYAAAGAFEEPERSLFYRKALGIRRYYENCPLNEYSNHPLFPSGARIIGTRIYPNYLQGLACADWEFKENEKELVEKFNEDFRK